MPPVFARSSASNWRLGQGGTTRRIRRYVEEEQRSRQAESAGRPWRQGPPKLGVYLRSVELGACCALGFRLRIRHARHLHATTYGHVSPICAHILCRTSDAPVEFSLRNPIRNRLLGSSVSGGAPLFGSGAFGLCSFLLFGRSGCVARLGSRCVAGLGSRCTVCLPASGFG